MLHFPKRWSLTGGLLAALLFASGAQAAMVMKMDLGDLAGNADKVFRGTVVSVEPGTVQAGGGELPAVVYTVQVDDAIKGNFGSGKDASFVELRMLGSLKADTQTGNIRRLSGVDINPKLTVGRTYVLFTTAPSPVGLSTTVGLNQGLFRVFNNAQGREMTANGLDNQGLFDGAVSYQELKNAIKAELN